MRQRPGYAEVAGESTRFERPRVGALVTSARLEDARALIHTPGGPVVFEVSGVARGSWPAPTAEHYEAVRRVLDSGVLVDGEETRALEREFAERFGGTALAVSNGTTALMLSLWASGIGRGSRVAIPALTFAACPQAVLAVGAEPVFVDVDLDTFCMAPGSLVADDVDAIMLVHVEGLAADVKPFVGSGVPVIEDACPAMGARHRGVAAGFGGTFGAFSFNAGKNVWAGEGGLVAGADPDRMREVRLLRDFGEADLDSPARSFETVAFGINGRLSEIEAALARVSLGQMDEVNERAQAVAAHLNAALEPTPLRPPHVPDGATHTYHKYRAWCPRGTRDRIAKALRGRDVPAGVRMTRALPYQPAFDRFADGFPASSNAQLVLDDTVIIGSSTRPLSSWSDVEVERYADIVKEVVCTEASG